MKSILTRIEQLPANVHSRCGWWVLVPFAIITIASLVMLTRLTFRPAIANLLPSGSALRVAEDSFDSHFAKASYVTLLYRTRPLFSAESLSRLSGLDRRLQHCRGVASVLSAANLDDMIVGGRDISFERLYGGEFSRDNTAALQRRVLQTPLFRRFLLSRDGSSFTIYVFPKKGADPNSLARELISSARLASRRGVQVLAYGQPIMRYDSKMAAPHDLLLLGTISLLLVFLLESLFARSLRIGAVLFVASLLPAVWSLALFPTVGVSMTIYSAVVPIMVVALSTSYGIHLMRHHLGSAAGSMTATLASVAPVILTAGGTTMLGFASLLLTPIPLLRNLGALVLPGILFAVVASVFALPPILSRAAASVARARGRRNPGRTAPAFAGTAHRPRTARGLVMIAFGIGVILLVVGALRVHYDFRIERGFKSDTTFGAMVREYTKRNGGLEQLEISIDTGREYGLVDPSVYAGVVAIERAATAGADASALSFTDFVDWVDSRLSGGSSRRGSEPSKRAIGEDLQLLFSSENGLRIGSLVDPGYRRARVIVRFGDEHATAQKAFAEFAALKSRVRSAARRTLPARVRVRFFGSAQERLAEDAYLVESQVYSSIFFFAVLAILLLVAFRSLRWTLLVLLPPLSGLLMYFGTLGWLGFSFNPFTVFMVSAVMGVGNDDVLFYVVSLRRHLRTSGLEDSIRRTSAQTGAAIVQTTVVLAAALCVLWFSQFFYVASQGVVGGATLAACTAVTYWVVPVVVRWNPQKWSIGARRI